MRRPKQWVLRSSRTRKGVVRSSSRQLTSEKELEKLTINFKQSKRKNNEQPGEARNAIAG
jgi:hypothetical protein